MLYNHSERQKKCTPTLIHVEGRGHPHKGTGFSSNVAGLCCVVHQTPVRGHREAASPGPVSHHEPGDAEPHSILPGCDLNSTKEPAAS